MNVSMKVGAMVLALALQPACGGKSANERSETSASGGEAGGSNVGGSDASAGASRGGSSAGGSAGGASIIYLYDENNYRTETRLSIPTVQTSASEDIEICWTDLTSDLDCNTVEPQSDVDTVGLFKFRELSETDIETLFAAGEISASNVDSYFSFESDHSSRLHEPLVIFRVRHGG